MRDLIGEGHGLGDGPLTREGAARREGRHECVRAERRPGAKLTTLVDGPLRQFPHSLVLTEHGIGGSEEPGRRLRPLDRGGDNGHVGEGAGDVFPIPRRPSRPETLLVGSGGAGLITAFASEQAEVSE